MSALLERFAIQYYRTQISRLDDEASAKGERGAFLAAIQEIAEELRTSDLEGTKL